MKGDIRAPAKVPSAPSSSGSKKKNIGTGTATSGRSDNNNRNKKTATETSTMGDKSSSAATTPGTNEVPQGTEHDDEVLLSQLMTALAAGARAVQGMPLEDEFEFQSSFPEFRQGVEEAHESFLDVVLTTLAGCNLEQDDKNQSNMFNSLTGGLSLSLESIDNLDDPLLWEACSEICELLLEQAEYNSKQDSTYGGNAKVQQELVGARNQARKSFGRLLKGIVDMEKPQSVYGFETTTATSSKNNARNKNTKNSNIGNGGRTDPFVPLVSVKYNAIKPLDLTFQPGHGIDTRFEALKPKSTSTQNVNNINKNIIAPSQHVAHVYQYEIEQLTFKPWQMEAPSTKPPKIQIDQELNATWIDTPQALEQLAAKLKTVQVVALDLEAHSYRSFSGMICLIQITIGNHDNYLIDPFPFWPNTSNKSSKSSSNPKGNDGSSNNNNDKSNNPLQSALGPTLTDPNVVKVLHGADSDIQWLQRDFGLYIVNLFDTGRAARAMSFSNAGYAHLLQRYVDIVPDKSHQLSDWRQRPLPQAMRTYAIMDTHYLLDIYEHLKYDLSQHATATIEEVLEESKKVCLIRYSPDAFKPDGYKTLLSRRGNKKADLNPIQEQVLKDLWDWRDKTARLADESHAYVATNQSLMRLALACPTTLMALQGILQPMPPLVLRHSKQVLTLVQRNVNSSSSGSNNANVNNIGTPNAKGPAYAYFKPASAEDRDEDPGTNNSNIQRGGDGRALLSPVLGTEALYRQAGWISPHPPATKGEGSAMIDDEDMMDDGDEPADIVATSTTDDDDDDNDHRTTSSGDKSKPQRVLSLHDANQKYRSNQFSSHSLQLGNIGGDSSSNRRNTNSTKNASGASQNSKKKYATSSAGSSNHSNTSSSGAIDKNSDGNEVVISEVGTVVDGLGPARAVRPDDDMEVEAHLAQTNAAMIRRAAQQQRLGSTGSATISPTTDMDDADDVDADVDVDDDADDADGEDDAALEDGCDADKGEGEDDERASRREEIAKNQEQEDFAIPRSMREIYRISNRNRRNKKTAGSSSSNSNNNNGNSPAVNEREAQELARAEEILKVRSLQGKDYLSEISGSPKRQRTKSTGGASSSSDETGGVATTPTGGGSNGGSGNDFGSSGVSRDDDIVMMQEIGWIKSKEEVEEMLNARPQSSMTDGDQDDSTKNQPNNGSNGDGSGDDDTATRGGPSGNNSATTTGTGTATGAVTAPATAPHGKPSSSSSPAAATSTATTPYDYTNVGGIGALGSGTTSANPFFTGVAVTGGHLNNKSSSSNSLRSSEGGNSNTRKKQSNSRNKQTRRQKEGNTQQQSQQQQLQTERPERREGRSQAYKKR